MADGKKKVPVFSPCKHHAGENTEGLGWDATDDACQDCLEYFPDYAESCKNASAARKQKGSVQFVEVPVVEKDLPVMHKSDTTAEEALAHAGAEKAVIHSKTTKQPLTLPIEVGGKVKHIIVAEESEGGEEEVATKVVEKKATAEKKPLAGKKVAVKKEGHSFRAGTARGEIHAMLSKGMAFEKVVARTMEKYGYAEGFAKSKVAVVKKLANL